MADAKPSAPRPDVKYCEQGRLEVTLPAGEWSLHATCQAHTPVPDTGSTSSPIPPPTSQRQPQKISGRHTMVAEDLEPYDKVLRKAMCRALSRPDLRLLCADLGFGTDFVEGEKLELECQRVIDECKRRGRAKMETLLKLLRALPTDWTFPELPPEGDAWWTV